MGTGSEHEGERNALAELDEHLTTMFGQAFENLTAAEEHLALEGLRHSLLTDLRKAGVIDSAVARIVHARRFVEEGRDHLPTIVRQVDERGLPTGGGIRLPRVVVRPDQVPYYEVPVFEYAADGNPQAVNNFSPYQARALANAIAELAFEQEFGRLPHLSPDLTQITQEQAAA